MNFLIADTFTDSLAKLSGTEQKSVKTTAFDLQTNPTNPGLRYHKLERVKDPGFCSVSASMDIRLIVHRSDNSLLLCYVDHHDQAYRWAQTRKLKTHPKTGAAQLVEIRETVKEIVTPVYTQPEAKKHYLFEHHSDDELLDYGVPEEWLEDVKQATEDFILELADHLPAEAAEALLDIATGGTPETVKPVRLTQSPFEHPDAKRRFRVMSNQEELERALDYPWEKWTVFLYPKQRQFAEQAYKGPARVSGSAGTGKTIVALHRAVNLARDNADSRVLLTTFSDALANALHDKLKRLISNEPRLAERLEVHSMQSIAIRLFERTGKMPKVANQNNIKSLLLNRSSQLEDAKFTQNFLLSEWNDVVDAWQLNSWEAYRDVKRLGRKIRLPEAQRAQLWSFFEAVRAELKQQGMVTWAELFSGLAVSIAANKYPPFEHVVVDEAQDISIAQLRFIAAIAGKKPDGLFFAGDLGQRIFQQPFSWKSLGVDIRGRSRTLKINYRTSHQIRRQADRLLQSEISDIDGYSESRGGTISIFNSEPPEVKVLDNQEQEIAFVAEWLKQRLAESVDVRELGIFVRSENELDRAVESAKQAGCHYKILDEKFEMTQGALVISTMHLAKGLEFRAVVVMACDDEAIPLQSRIETVADETDLEEIYNTERHLLYVACTRARDHLLVTATDPESEFLDDLLG